MVSKLDLRSFVAGAIAGLVAVTFFGAQLGPALPGSPNPEIGRFQIDAAGTSSGIDAFIIDTVTGKVWQKGHNVPGRDTDFFRPKIGAEAKADSPKSQTGASTDEIRKLPRRNDKTLLNDLPK